MNKIQANETMNRLIEAYPEAGCELHFDSVFHLLIAVILSAQCTDKRVNVVTEKLFKKYKTVEDFAGLSERELGEQIFSCGFYHNKSKNIINAAKAILTDYGGQVPNTFEQLLGLPGVGRKTANVVMSEAYDGNNLAVDTHVFRVSKRIGFTLSNTPNGVEKDLVELFEKSLKKIHHTLIFHGRYCCKSQNPQCESCVINSRCEYNIMQKGELI